ncbi:MAG: ATP-dependent Clp protease ATP-binding subunit [Candidatus Peribacteria bacterium]|nr:MAG: ATP-dependent Clp protease ATP-binding subunit [Candidatus Peribacteria bacterium]
MSQLNYTREAHETLQYAQLLSFADDKKHISSLTLFWAIYMMVDQYDFAPLFWSLLGVKDIELLEEYFDDHYGAISIDELPSHYSLVHTLIEGMAEESDRQAVDFAKLLYVSINRATQETQAVLASLEIDRDILLSNCHYIIHHPVISQVGLFVFLDILAKLVDKLPLDISAMQIMNINMDMIHNHVDNDTVDPTTGADSKGSASVTSTVTDTKEESKLTIEYFSTDLVREAKNKELDPIIGREKEIDQMIYTLLRKTKNNPLLLGEAGVGKTAAVEGLAQRMVSGDVPEKLKGMRIMMLDMTAVVAGTKYRGEFEARMKAILEEATDPTNHIIMFIDEIHTMIGAGGQENGDAAQMVKPLLARGKIKLIGATTFDEYQKHIEKDAALKRRFQEVIVDEPDFATATTILTGLKETYEDYHGVTISDEAIVSAVKLSSRYILNKYLPDKAIDLIDEASAKVSTLAQKLELNTDYQKKEEKIAKIDAKIEKAIEKQDYFEAAELKKQQEALKKDLLTVRKTVALPPHLRPTVDVSAIADILSSKTGIPATMVQESEMEKLKRLKIDLGKEVLGQADATHAVVSSLMRSRLSAVERNKPIASFLFLGPSGTGKTHLAKTIARDYFADEKALIRVDMSEFMESYSVSKLI